jgi:hypothetical protein
MFQDGNFKMTREFQVQCNNLLHNYVEKLNDLITQITYNQNRILHVKPSIIRSTRMERSVLYYLHPFPLQDKHKIVVIIQVSYCDCNKMFLYLI